MAIADKRIPVTEETLEKLKRGEKKAISLISMRLFNELSTTHRRENCD